MWETAYKTTTPFTSQLLSCTGKMEKRWNSKIENFKKMTCFVTEKIKHLSIQKTDFRIREKMLIKGCQAGICSRVLILVLFLNIWRFVSSDCK